MGTLRFAHPTFFALRFTLDFKAPLMGLFCGQHTHKLAVSPIFFPCSKIHLSSPEVGCFF